MVTILFINPRGFNYNTFDVRLIIAYYCNDY